MDFIGYILASTAGLIMVVGCLVLLAKGRIVLDAEGKSISNIELPGGIKLSTQFPVLVMFFLGVVLLVYPVYQAKNVCIDPSLHKLRIPEIVTISGQVSTTEPIDLYAIVGEQKRATNSISLTVPYISDRPYYIFRSAPDGGLYALTSITLPDTKPPHVNVFTLPGTLKVQPSGTAAPLDLNTSIRSVSQDQLNDFKKPEVQQ